MKFPRNITLAVLPIRYLLELNETLRDNISFTGGIEAELFKILSRRLGFTFKLVTPSKREWGTLKSDGQWTGLMGMVNRSEADMALSEIAITEQRNRAVDFVPYYSDATTFVRSISPEVPNATFYVKPFNFDLWFACLFFLLMYPLLICFINKELSYFPLFLQLLGCVLKQPFVFNKKSMKVKYLLGLWILWTMFIAFSYSAVLFSFMSVPLHVKGIETIQELATAMSTGDYECYAFRGSSDHEFLLNSNDTWLQSIGHMIHSNDWMFDVDDVPEHIESNTAKIGYRSLLELDQAAEVVPTKYIFKEDIAVWHAGIAVRKDFCCKKALHKIVNGLNAGGILKQLYDAEIHKRKVHASSVHLIDLASAKPLTFSDLSRIFLILCAGYMVSIVVFLFQFIKCGRQNDENALSEDVLIKKETFDS